MSIEFVLPILALLAVAVVLGHAPWELPPRLAVRALALVAAVAATTVALVVVATAAGFVLGPARRAEVVEWCRIVPLHHEVQLLEGLAALIVSAVMAVRSWRVLHRRRLAVAATVGRRLSILDTPEPVAYAAPGRPGCVVVSTGLLSALAPRERQVVFAHERAHLRQRHHRYLLVGSLAVAIVPILRPLVERLRLATERCADEEAASALGGDRQLVATAITKAALSTTAFNGVVPAFNGGPVVARVNALIGSPPGVWRAGTGLASLVAGTGAAVGAGFVQVHHLWVVVDHICNG